MSGLLGLEMRRRMKNVDSGVNCLRGGIGATTKTCTDRK